MFCRHQIPSFGVMFLFLAGALASSCTPAAEMVDPVIETSAGPPDTPPSPPPTGVGVDRASPSSLLPAPSFPWPPPSASAIEVISRPLLETQAGQTRLRDVADRITGALQRNGYNEHKFYQFPGGFALVTRMEQMEADGTSKANSERWILDNSSTLEQFSVTAYLRALFTASPGYYRVFVFIVTTNPIMQSTNGPRPDDAMNWLVGGLNTLPETIGELDFADNYAGTALIYEFVRETEDAEAYARIPGEFQGSTHLEKAGILAALGESQ